MTGIERLRDIVDDGPYSGGMIHISVQKLREICEQIEAEASVETVKAEAIRAADNRRVELCAALGIDTDTGWSDAMAEMVKRLMPDGMEWLVEAWPRFEDDSPVHFGDTALIDGEADMVEAVQLWIHGKPVIYGDGGSQQLDKGERVKRPAPKVLDADGVEVRVGDTVWTTRDLDKFTVTNPNNGQFLSVSCKDEGGDDYCCHPSDLTHRAPVLAADGKPLHEGEHVYHVETGTELVVNELPKPGEYQAVVVFALPTSHLTSFDPDQLTHERPVADTWERLEDDATLPAATYCERRGIVDDGGYSPEELMALDLVRRAKKLAVVSE